MAETTSESFKRLHVAMLDRDGIHGATILERGNDGELKVYPFESETEATVFDSVPIALVDRDKIDEFLLDDIDMIVKGDDASAALKKIDALLRNANLYAETLSHAVVLQLSRNGVSICALTARECSQN